MEDATTLKMVKICRFCLSQDEEYLIPIAEAPDFSLEIEDVARFTGIDINEDNKTVYAMCLECTENLKHTAIFRDTCLSNDALFHELYDAMVSSVKEMYGDTIEYLDSDFEDFAEEVKPVDTVEDVPMKIESLTKIETLEEIEILASPQQRPEPTFIQQKHCPVVQPQLPQEHYRAYSPPAASCISNDESIEYVFADDDENFAHSANYIEIGEPMSYDDLWMVDYNEPPRRKRKQRVKKGSFVKRTEGIPEPLVNDGYEMEPIFAPMPTPTPKEDDCWLLQERPRVKRKRHLCDECGALTNHLKSHVRYHRDERLEVCPHCPATFRHVSNLRGHIQQIHVKKICKTCEICGKGFIHHKTYRYHMLNHANEGKRFECKDCGKSFSNEIYLRDHYNRLHNITKTLVASDPGSS